jgi:hypothetical protein
MVLEHPKKNMMTMMILIRNESFIKSFIIRIINLEEY